MSFGYTETFGAPDLREAIASTYANREAPEILCFAGAEAFFERHPELFDWYRPDGACTTFPKYKGPDGVEAFTQLETAMRAFALTTTLKGKVLDMDALRQFEQEGVQISTWSDADLQVWKEQTQNVYQEHRDRNENFKRLLDDKVSFKKKYDDYYKTHGPYDK